MFPGFWRVRENSSFAPLGLIGFPTFTHGLRRGLRSFAAPQLDLGAGLTVSRKV